MTARDTIEYMSEAHECFTTEAVWESSLMEETFASQIGITSRLFLDENELLEQNHQLDLDNSILPQAEPSFLPIALDYFAYYLQNELPLNPWNLEFAYNAADESMLIWNSPSQIAECQTYRIYANEVIIDEIVISERQYSVPLPIDVTTDFYVTGFDGTNETEPSNTITWIVPTGDDNNQIPQNITQLSQNVPNPFYTDKSRSGTTQISFYLAKDSHTALDIYNCRGRKIKKLINKTLTAGDHQFEWDGTNAGGSHVATGVYFYKLSAGNFTQTRKLLLIR